MLAGKSILVVGASRGIGLATALLFAQHGARVFIAARTGAALDLAAHAIRKQVVEADLHSLCCDVTDEQSVKQAFASLLAVSPVLDGVVMCAGILESRLIGMADQAHMRRIFDTNALGSFFVSQFASRLMLRRNAGSIVLLSSVVGISGAAGQTVYAASKAAVIGFTKSLAKEMASRQIRVNAIAPGFIATQMTESLPAAVAERTLSAIGMARAGSPEDVAKVALFLVSDLSSYVTGQVIEVDGGLVI